MNRKNFAFWCCSLLLLVVSSSKSRQNSTSNEDKNDNSAVQYQLDVNSITNFTNKMETLSYDFHEKSSNYIHDMQNDDTQYEFRKTSTSNDRKNNDSMQYELGSFFIQNQEDDKRMPIQHRTNSTSVSYKKDFMLQENENLMKIKDKNDFTLQEFLKNFSKDNNKISNIISYEMCHNITCIKLCCPLGDRFDEQNDTCISANITYSFPIYKYTNDLLQNKNKTVDELFQLTVYDPCKENDHRFLLPYGHQYNYTIFTNGSLYLSYFKTFANWSSYCLAILEGNEFEVTICSKTPDEIIGQQDFSLIKIIKIIHVSFHIVSILFLISIFLVYSILPQLRNVHGFMLRNYSGALSVAYIIDIVNIIIKSKDVLYPVCLTIAFFQYFCSLTSFFWLNVMSFDMWWTFRKWFLLQKNIRHREKSKLVFYAIYAWGLPFIFAITSIIMDFVPENVPQILRPEFHTGDCWFNSQKTFALYYYGFKSICIISSICLSISTAVKIARYKKDTGHRLSNSESKRYNDNKKWLNLYLKLFIMLFIVMGIKWSVTTVSWLFQPLSIYYSAIINVIDIVQNFCTFIIFVWKKKVKQMLLKRFGFGRFAQARSTNVTSSKSKCFSTTSRRYFCRERILAT